MAAPDIPTRVFLRPVANPLPLGFIGLAVATTMFAAVQLDWLAPAEARVAAIAALFFTVPVQLLAAVFGFLARDPVAGTGMGILAGTWATVSVVTLTTAPGSTSAGLGVALVAAGAVLLVPATPAWRSRWVPAAVLTTTAIRFAVTGVYHLTGSSSWQLAAGIVGMVLAALAVYGALAMELEDAQHRTVLPMLRRGPGRAALSGDTYAQIESLNREAGVRRQL